MFGLLSSFQLFLTSFMMFLTGGEVTQQLDLSLVGEVMDIVVQVITKALGLFTVFPLNLYLILGLIGMSIGIFFSLKRGARR